MVVLTVLTRSSPSIPGIAINVAHSNMRSPWLNDPNVRTAVDLFGCCGGQWFDTITSVFHCGGGCQRRRAHDGRNE